MVQDERRASLRVSDAEREQVAARLVRAHGEGRLGLAEFDERVRAAHGAVVAADLAPLTADLPAETPAPVPAPVARRSPTAWGPPVPWPVPHGMPVPLAPVAPSLRTSVAVWAAVSAINVVIWVAVVAGTGALVAPWWIWVAGPWGVVLALRALGERRRTAGGATAGPSGSLRPGGSSRR